MKRTLLLMAAVGLFSAIPATPDNGSIPVCHFVSGSNNWNLIWVSKKELANHLPGHQYDTPLVMGNACLAVYAG